METLLNSLKMIRVVFVTAVDPPVRTDGFLDICRYCSKCFSLIFSMSKAYKYLF